MKRQQVLYVQIADTLRKELLDGVYPVGTKMPTEGALEQRFEVSKITVRKAIELLTHEGYLEKKSGVGTTVLSNRLFNHLSKGESFSGILEKEGHVLEKEILAIEKIKIEKNDPILADLGRIAIKISRVYYFENQPYVLFEHYIPNDVKQIKKERLVKQSLYHLLANSGYEIARFRDAFKMTNMTDAEKALLQYQGEFIMERNRFSYDQDNRLIEYSRAIYNTELQPYLIEFEV